MEKETLAILKSVSHFKNIIYGTEINIFTDNSNLLSRKNYTKRINRWIILLNEMNINMKHIKGVDNAEPIIYQETI